MARIIYTDMAGTEQTISIDYNSPIVTIGRAVDCNIRSNRKSVSRHHAEFKFSNNQVHVQDLNSSNGTFIIINDQRRAIMGTQIVNDNDEIWCGDFVLRYEAYAETVSAPPERLSPMPTFAESPEVAFNATQPPGLDPPSEPQSKKLGLGLSTSPPSDPQTNPFGSPPPFEPSGFDPLSEDIAELERLMAEKSSIEDLATRQAQEIDRLEGLLENSKRESTQSVEALKETEEENDKKEQEIQRLQRALSAQNRDDTVADLEEEVLSLRALNAELRQKENKKENKEESDALQHQLIQKDAEIEELGETNSHLGELNDKLMGEVEETKLTIESLNTLLSDLNQQALSQEESSEKDDEIRQLEARLAKESQEREALSELNEILKKEHDKEKEKHQKDISALKEKQILLEKEKASLQLQSQNVAEQQNSNQDFDESKKELVVFLTKLERIVDAIQRADLSPLSTVDRVRLQSAIRESKPKSTLRSFIEKNSE